MNDIAIVGCGAVSETFYLPGLTELDGRVDHLVLVDKDERRLDRLADEYGADRVTTDYQDIAGEVDGAVIATPHHLHYSMASDFIDSGAHVLIEKPVAETAEQARELSQKAEEGGVGVLVNNTRRLFPSYARAKELVEQGKIGEVERITYEEGGEYNWPTTSGFYFTSGTGVLLDRGAHVLDLVCWWMDETPQLTSYRDDSFGGCEAVAEVKFGTGTCYARVKLSWLNKLDNRYVIEGTRGKIEGEIYEWDKLTLTTGGNSRQINISSDVKYFEHFRRPLLRNFLDMIEGSTPSKITPYDVEGSIALMEQCYSNRQQFDLPWMKSLETTTHE
ncbi:putative dehydrogenase [Salinibacter ruber]|uniref:Gfo/Idh/MocA family protein n=1 Tax=Salinibacter ruber TaxID=146919 RepID=UPI00216A3E35|nr:Gfo/Idh/MocA family oxidoreductase [Salinibacter ruber]MCS4193421.1 putative dehydrogenase [Salinibacter ruber]